MSTEELRKAVDAADNACAVYKLGLEGRRHWGVIKQALRDQEAEIARLRKIEEERWNVVATRNAAVERAEKADALLRAIKAWDVDSFPSRKTLFALPLYIRARITAHLGAEQ